MERMQSRVKSYSVGLMLAVCLLAAPPQAGAQESALGRLADALPAEAMGSLMEALRSAEGRGLPVEPLVNKALEGAAKGVAAERVLAAVRELARGLDQARALLPSSPPPTAGELSAAADVLGRGAPGDALRRLGGRRVAGEPFEVAIHTLGDLLERGVAVDVALEVLEAWRSGGTDPEQLRGIPAALDGLTRQGMSPENAAREVAQRVAGGRPPHAGPPIGRQGPPQEREPVVQPGRGSGGPPRGSQ